MEFVLKYFLFLRALSKSNFVKERNTKEKYTRKVVINIVPLTVKNSSLVGDADWESSVDPRRIGSATLLLVFTSLRIGTEAAESFWLNQKYTKYNVKSIPIIVSTMYIEHARHVLRMFSDFSNPRNAET